MNMHRLAELLDRADRMETQHRKDMVEIHSQLAEAEAQHTTRLDAITDRLETAKRLYKEAREYGEKAVPIDFVFWGTLCDDIEWLLADNEAMESWLRKMDAER